MRAFFFLLSLVFITISCEPEPIVKEVCVICDDPIHFQQTPWTFMWIPNAFTPNGDGLNDDYTFVSGWGSGFGLDSFKISDPAGAIIYSVTDQSEIDDESNTWDGIVNGETYEGEFKIQVWYGDGDPENLTREVRAYSIPCLDQVNKEYPNIEKCRPRDDASGMGVDLKSNLEDFPSC